MKSAIELAGMAETLQNAVSLGSTGRFREMRVLCQQLLQDTADMPLLLDLGVLLTANKRTPTLFNIKSVMR